MKNRTVRVGALHFRWAHIPVDGYLPYFTRYCRDGVRWFMEWRYLWVWWEPTA